MTLPPSRLGHYRTSVVGGEEVRAFIPPPLPPVPSLTMENLWPKLETTMHLLGKLQGMAALVPDRALFLYMYVRKEALVSSHIEGTQSSLHDLLLFEHNNTPSTPMEDVEEVSNYVAALEYGLSEMQRGSPLCNRLLKQCHAILLQGVRGQNQQPGEYRRSQNWIGGTRPGNARFVPPPQELVESLMSDLEKYLHDPTQSTPVLLRVGMAHVQFETIHPFLDGNGRLGRLMIALALANFSILPDPLLYISLFFKQHRDEYYHLLQHVRTTGDWEAWCEFYLEGVAHVASHSADAIQRIHDLTKSDRERIETLGRAAVSVHALFRFCLRAPLFGIPQAAIELSLSVPTVTKATNHLLQLGILKEITGKGKNRLYAYQGYLDILMAEG